MVIMLRTLAAAAVVLGLALVAGGLLSDPRNLSDSALARVAGRGCGHCCNDVDNPDGCTHTACVKMTEGQCENLQEGLCPGTISDTCKATKESTDVCTTETVRFQARCTRTGDRTTEGCPTAGEGRCELKQNTSVPQKPCVYDKCDSSGSPHYKKCS